MGGQWSSFQSPKQQRLISDTQNVDSTNHEIHANSKSQKSQTDNDHRVWTSIAEHKNIQYTSDLHDKSPAVGESFQTPSVSPSESVVPSTPPNFCSDTNEAKDPCSSQWMMLYTFASYASENPDESERQMLSDFFNYFPDQCTTGLSAYCYTDAIRKTPPHVANRRELLLWLCSIENYCRKQAGQPTRLCRYDDLMKRWRFPDGYL